MARSNVEDNGADEIQGVGVSKRQELCDIERALGNLKMRRI